MIHTLAPIKESTSDYEDLVEIISDYFKQEIYLPLLEDLKSSEGVLKNSVEDLNSAIRSGKISFNRGVFSGKLNSKLTLELKKIGATWDRRQGRFRIPLSRLPKTTRDAIEVSEARFKRLFRKMDDRLAKFLPEKIAEHIQVHQFFDKTIFRMDEKIQKTLKGISVVPELSKETRSKIASEYTNNVNLYIKDFTDKEITKLRKKMKTHVFDGRRYEAVVDEIQKSYGVTRNKAKFLARQETGLLMSTFRQSRYEEAGSEGYIWTCVVGTADHPVRPMHKKLDGQLIRWDKPPIVNSNGDRKHAGADYNCRCYPKPIVRF